jgi:hypothetical protein
MVYIQTKKPNLGIFWRVLHFYILRPFGIFYGYSVYFMDIWYFFRFRLLHQEKSGNPADGVAEYIHASYHN